MLHLLACGSYASHIDLTVIVNKVVLKQLATHLQILGMLSVEVILRLEGDLVAAEAALVHDVRLVERLAHFSLPALLRLAA